MDFNAQGALVTLAVFAILVVIAIGLYFVQARTKEKSERKMLSTRDITEVAIFISLAFVIEILVSWIPRQPQGGSITFSLVPLIVLAYRKGFIATLYAGIIFGILNWMLAGFAIWVHPMEGPLDYLLANGAVALSAIVFKYYRGKARYFIYGAIVGGLGRYFMHFLSGIIFFGIYAPEDQSVWAYSIIYNGTYMVPTIIIVSFLSWALYSKMHTLLEEDLV